MFFKRRKQNQQNYDYQRLFAYDFDQNNAFFIDKNEQKHFIKMIKVDDISAIFTLNNNSYDFLLKQLKNTLLKFKNFKVIKLLKNPELLIDVDKKYELIDQINHSFYSSTYVKSSNHQNLLAKKFQLLNLIKTKHNEEIDWIKKEKNIYLFFSDSNLVDLDANLNDLINLLNKSKTNFQLLNSHQCFDQVKLILNKNDQIKSAILNVDSRLNKHNLFNIDQVSDQQNHFLINQQEYLRLVEIDLVNSSHIKNLFNCFKTLDVDIILDFQKNNSKQFNVAKLILINRANSLKELDQNQEHLKKQIHTYHFRINYLVNKQLETYFNLIISQMTKEQLVVKNYEIFEQIIDFNFLAVNKLHSKNGSLVGYNQNHELIYVNAKANIISIGKPKHLFMKLINEKIVKLNSVVIYDYDHEFALLNQYYNQEIFDFKNFVINPFAFDEKEVTSQAIRTKINFITKLFQMIDSDLNHDQLLELKTAVEQLYLPQVIKVKKTKTTKKKTKEEQTEKIIKPDLASINFSNLLEKLKTNQASAKLISITNEFLLDPFLNQHFNQPTNLDLSDELLITFDLSTLKKESLINQKISILILNDFLNKHLSNSTIYLNNFDMISNQKQLLEQLFDFENNHFNLYGFLSPSAINLDDQLLVKWLKSIQHLNLIPQQDYQNHFWNNLLLKLEINEIEKEINALDTINDQQYLLITNQQKYWYINQCFEFEANAWNNKILDRHLSKYEINKILRNQIDEIETKIYYMKKAQDDIIKNFLIKNASHPEVQKKIKMENQNYIKKLL